MLALIATNIIGGETPIVSTALTAFRARFPAFDATPDARIEYWLSDSARFIEETVFGTDFDLAQMLYAAHNLTLAGDGGSVELANMPDGITSLRSGSLSLSFDTQTAQREAMGGWDATKYGVQLLALLKMKNSGPRVTEAGAIPAYGYPYRAGILGGY